MDTIDRSRYENNSLKEEIERLLEFCKQQTYVYGASSFKEPISEREMSSWEEKTGITIPESYKEWLRFSGDSTLLNYKAFFWGPDKFNSDFVPDDYIIIGEIIGDCEFICFSMTDGRLVYFMDGEISEEYDSFKDVIEAFIEMIE